MGKTTYDKALEVIKRNFKDGERVGLMKLQAVVGREVGSDPRTIFKVLKLISSQGIIEDINHAHFKIHYAK